LLSRACSLTSVFHLTSLNALKEIGLSSRFESARKKCGR
jgi:hypothetical protein